MLVEFLKSVLPTQGYKCWVEINRAKKVTQGFVPTIEELAAKTLEISARGSDRHLAERGRQDHRVEDQGHASLVGRLRHAKPDR